MRYAKLYPALLCFAAGLIVIAAFQAPPRELWEGLDKIVFSEDSLITDYIAFAGLGPAFLNAGIVGLVCISIMMASGVPANGFTIVVVGLMTGFSFFGKNLFNITPILAGALLRARVYHVPVATFITSGLLATSLSPVVSYLTFHDTVIPFELRLLIGAGLGVLIGFSIPPLAAHTFKIQNGMNLYNLGFAAGMFGTVVSSVLVTAGVEPVGQFYWATDVTDTLTVFLLLFCAGLILTGFCCDRRALLRRYGRLLRTTGRAPSDYLRMYGPGPVLLNSGINGLLALGYLRLIGGDVNGATMGGVLIVMCFSGYGKHPRNILPVMFGVWLCASVSAWGTPLTPGAQLAAMFGTTLAPISGVFGPVAGVATGFLHMSVVMRAGAPLGGLNLYNNGFCAGLVSIVLYPLLTAVLRERKTDVSAEETAYRLFVSKAETVGPGKEDK
ncbi:MAG TPA: DUF1576 domain-containing protein [Oscillospiraceae bacterium]|nr:DUF1576 domain-containing protein [Oscillospiraceae bacterium]